MKREQVNYFAVGLFVLACLGGLFYLLLKLTGSGNSMVRYHVVYPSVHGIISGTPVFYQGFRVGQVEEIARANRDGEGVFELLLNVSAEQPIASDSVAHVFESGLLGTVSIDIRGGDSDRTLPPDGFIAGAERHDLLDSINAAADEYRALSRDQLRPLVAKLNLRVDSLADTVEQGAQSLITDLQQLTASLNRSAAQLETVLSADNSARVAQILADAQTFSGDTAKLGTELRASNRKLGTSIDQANRVLVNSNRLVSEVRPDLRASLHDLRNTLHVVSDNISSITRHLDSTTRNLDEFSRQIRQNPGLLLGSTPPTTRR